MANSWLGWLARNPGPDPFSPVWGGGEKPDWEELVPPWSPNRLPWPQRDIRRLLELLGFPQFDSTWSDTPPRPFGGPGSEPWPGIYSDLLLRGPGLKTRADYWSDIPPMPKQSPPPDPRRTHYPPQAWRGQWEGHDRDWNEDNFWTDIRWNSRIGRVY